MTRPEKAHRELKAFLHSLLSVMERTPPREMDDGEGGIDLHWKAFGHEILINVPPSGTASYYADDKADISAKGEIGLDVE